MKTLAILLILTVCAVFADAAIITHSHCPNHSRNNAENMHTHDTTDPDHNDKHKAGHPHTTEFDEFCPKGTERDTSKKSGNFNGGDGNTGQGDTDTPQETRGGDDTSARTVKPVGRTSQPVTNILRITHVSFAEVWGRGRVRTYATLALEITAVAPETAHNGLIIVVNDTPYRTPQNFFGARLMGKGDMRRVTLTAKPANSAVFLKVQSPKNSRSLPATQREWRVIENFDITNFMLAIQDTSGTRDRITHAHIDADGNRRGYTQGAPRLIKPKLTTMWARLKKQK